MLKMIEDSQVIIIRGTERYDVVSRKFKTQKRKIEYLSLKIGFLFGIFMLI